MDAPTNSQEIPDAGDLQEQKHVVVGEGMLVYVLLCCLCALLGFFVSVLKFPYMQQNGISMLTGMAVGVVLKYWREENQRLFEFQPEFFFYVLLPPLIFEAGYTMKSKSFFRNMGTILFFAVLGTIVSAFVVGYGNYFCAQAGLQDSVPSLLGNMMFGVLISAIDPVGTLAVLSQRNDDPLVGSLLFGESVLNDAVAIVLFRSLRAFRGTAQFTHLSLLEIAADFLFVFVCSALMGIVIALATAFVLHWISMKRVPHYELIVMSYLAYVSYVLAEVVGLSGVTSLLFCGIVNAHYSWHNISEVSQTSTLEMFKAMSNFAETVAYVYLGLAVFTFDDEVHWDGKFVLSSVLFCVLGRALNIFGLSALVNRFRANKVSLGMQIFLWVLGLRGAVAFALVLNIQHLDAFPLERPTLIAATLFLIISSTLGLGAFTVPLANLLKLDASGSDTVHVRSTSPEESYIHDIWKKVDEKFFKVIFGGRPATGAAAAASRSESGRTPPRDQADGLENPLLDDDL